MKQTRVKIKVGNATSRMVEVRTGLRKGDAPVNIFDEFKI